MKRTAMVTIRILPETLVDLDDFAQQRFPVECPACKGTGVSRSTGNVCHKCRGATVIGQRSEAARYLLHFALGAQATPEARAMAAVYENVAPFLQRNIMGVANKAKEDLREIIMESIASGISPMECKP